MEHAIPAKNATRAGATSDRDTPATGSRQEFQVSGPARPPGLAVAADRDAQAHPVAAREGAANLGALRRQADRREPGPIRRMSVAGVDVPSTVSGTTRTKHVVALANQAASAEAGYGSRTFVTSDDDLTKAVDADDSDFAAGPARSARVDIQADVPIYQYDKTEDPPAGMAQGKPVEMTVDGEETSCEIGAVKTGAGQISITHFKKA